MALELEKYRDLDEDKILSALTEEELRTLENELEELDPDNDLLPVGLRQRDQTKKTPTGPFKRDELLDHLEKQAKDMKDREDLVPFTGEKRGMNPLSLSGFPPLLLNGKAPG
uniref:Tropomodulin n=1 Tax=Chelonoidis abingdonii TaxID=106734 RepID=A0A8C0JCT6_CHEAB